MATTTGTVEGFTPTSGRFIGPLGLLTAAAVFIGGLVSGDEFPLPFLTGALFFAALIWAAVVRPRVQIRGDDLVLRNMLETVRVPLAAIESLVIRQLFVIRSGGRRYVNPSIGRTFREVTKDVRRFEGMPGGGRSLNTQALGDTAEATSEKRRTGADIHYADFVHDRVMARRDEECLRLGVRVRSAEQEALGASVRREPAWLEIGLLVVTAAVFVGSFFL